MRKKRQGERDGASWCSIAQVNNVAVSWVTSRHVFRETVREGLIIAELYLVG